MGLPLWLEAEVGRMEAACEPVAVYTEVIGRAALGTPEPFSPEELPAPSRSVPEAPDPWALVPIVLSSPSSPALPGVMDELPELLDIS